MVFAFCQAGAIVAVFAGGEGADLLGSITGLLKLLAKAKVNPIFVTHFFGLFYVEPLGGRRVVAEDHVVVIFAAIAVDAVFDAVFVLPPHPVEFRQIRCEVVTAIDREGVRRDSGD